MIRSTIVRGSVAIAAIATFAGVDAGAAHAVVPTATTYVSPGGTLVNTDTSCATAAYSSVQKAVDATAAGGTVIVCKGTYAESVTLTGLLTLQGRPGAVINAKGLPYAVGIAHSYDTVTGLTVENATATTTGAPGDGIITAGFVGGTPVPSDDDVIVGNIARGNEGVGIDLNSSTGSVASGNTANGNGGGINLSNDLGKPASHNLVIGNVTDYNPGGCGIILADHTGVGVFDNSIIGNVAAYNGLGTPSRPSASSGSGVILGGGSAKGGIWDNVIESNRLFRNGHGGVALHAHAPGLNFSGNKIIDNTIGKNNLRTDYKDTKTTGIYLGDASALRISVTGNLFQNDAIGIFAAGPVTVAGRAGNVYQNVALHYVHIAKYAG